jgi:DNA-directed RNA polymerase subunit L
MELDIIKDEGKEMVIEFNTSDFTLPDLIASVLNKDKDVSFAGAYKDHPEIGKPRLVVKTEKKKPKEALAKALKEIEGELSDLKEKVSKKSK